MMILVWNRELSSTIIITWEIIYKYINIGDDSTRWIKLKKTIEVEVCDVCENTELPTDPIILQNECECIICGDKACEKCRGTMSLNGGSDSPVCSNCMKIIRKIYGNGWGALDAWRWEAPCIQGGSRQLSWQCTSVGSHLWWLWQAHMWQVRHRWQGHIEGGPLMRNKNCTTCKHRGVPSCTPPCRTCRDSSNYDEESPW